MKKTLPVKQPLICSFLQHGIIFSVLYPQEECKPWIFSNFIQTFTLRNLYNADYRSGTIDFFYNQYGDFKYYEIKANPWLQTHDTPYELIHSLQLDIISLIKALIDSDQYVCLNVDISYISNYSYGNTHYSHPIFIRGYDDDSQTFEALDNFEYGKFTFQRLNYQEVQQGYQYIEKEFMGTTDLIIHWKGVLSFKVCKHFWQPAQSVMFELDLPKIINDLKEYLLLDHYGEQYRKSPYYRYGIECYDELILSIEQSDGHVDHRPFSAFNDHKLLMKERIAYLQKTVGLNIPEPIYTSAQDISTKMATTMMSIVKYNVTKDVRILERAKNQLCSCLEQEKIMLKHLIECLTEYENNLPNT